MALRRSRVADPVITRAPTPLPGAGPEGLHRAYDRLLGELLVEAGHVTPALLAEALLQQEQTDKRLGALLVELGMVDEQAVTEALARQFAVPVVDLGAEHPDVDALARVPEDVARRLTILPLQVVDGRLLIAAGSPEDPRLAGFVAQSLDGAVDVALAAPADIRRALDAAYRALGSVGSLVDAFQETEALRAGQAVDGRVDDDSPVVRMVTLLVTQGIRDRASDIHIEPQEDRIRVRFRIDGALHDVLSLPQSMGPALVSRLKIMAKMNIVDRRHSQDGQITTEVDGKDLDIRINTTPTIWGEKAVLRLLDRTRTLHDLDGLGMSAETARAYSRMVASPFGMVLCAGPTGSGKTTTLYATLTEINNSERNVTTIEDPVEYVFGSINQIQISEQGGMTFANGLRAVLRQDPDVILVGEIRDVETARIAVQSALTGHFVLSSLHATDASSALHRFLDMGIEPFLVASTVLGVVSQRLVRRLCHRCRTPVKPSVEELRFYREAGGEPKDTFLAGAGCNFCSNTGYYGRIGVFELLEVDADVKQHLVEQRSVDDLRAAVAGQGRGNLLGQAVRLVEQDVTSVAEIMRSIYTL